MRSSVPATSCSATRTGFSSSPSSMRPRSPPRRWRSARPKNPARRACAPANRSKPSSAFNLQGEAMGQTLTEKILSRVMKRPVKAGETIYPEPELVTVHDWYVVNFDKALQELGVDRLYDADKVLIATDHEPVALNVLSAERQRNMRKIAAKYGIKHFYDNGRGGHGHVFPMELGYIKPGMFVLAYDTHVTNYGAVGALGIAMITEITEVLACGSVWIRVPETIRVNLKGKLPAGITIRDISQKLTVDQDADLVDYCTVEFGGPALKDINVDQRMTLCNTPLEIGAKSAIVEPDQVVLDWLKGRVKEPMTLLKSDA